VESEDKILRRRLSERLSRASSTKHVIIIIIFNVSSPLVIDILSFMTTLSLLQSRENGHYDIDEHKV